MRRPPRLVLDTNIVVSAVLWGGKPAELLALAGDGFVRLHSSRVLFDELLATLKRPKLVPMVEAVGRTAGDIVSDYQRLCAVSRPRPLPSLISRDPDDDHVIACALAARAAFIVTGDRDLLVLGTVETVRIRSVSALLIDLA